MLVPTLAALALPPAEGLTFFGALENVPHNPAALFVYALLLACCVAIWKGSRHGPGGGAGAP